MFKRPPSWLKLERLFFWLIFGRFVRKSIFDTPALYSAYASIKSEIDLWGIWIVMRLLH